MEPVTWSAVAVAVIMALLNLRSNQGKVWKGEAEAQQAKAARLESELKALVTRVEKLEAENASLRELATSHKAIEELAEKVTANHAEIMHALESGN